MGCDVCTVMPETHGLLPVLPGPAPFRKECLGAQSTFTTKESSNTSTAFLLKHTLVHNRIFSLFCFYSRVCFLTYVSLPNHRAGGGRVVAISGLQTMG